MILRLTVLIVVLTVSNATLGVDLAGSLSTSTLQCIRNAGYSFAIARGFHSYGAVDTTANQTLVNAKNAGLKTDLYMFPCRGKNATQQVDQQVAGVTASLYQTIWIDVQSNPSSGCSWSGHDTVSNCLFLVEIINRVKQYGKGVGIYASASQWVTIFGGRTACPGASSVQLWYAHYDNVQAFSDFSPFGGWTKPVMKQFAGDATVCGTDIDKNYRP